MIFYYSLAANSGHNYSTTPESQNRFDTIVCTSQLTRYAPNMAFHSYHIENCSRIS